jgi:hypothetical protein
MNYYDAAKIRKKGFANLMSDKLTSGQGVISSLRETMSDRSKAKSLAMKERFDPMNIAKFLTGGSKLGPAIVGRLTGRSKDDIDYFTGKRRYEYTPRTPRVGTMFGGGSRKATEVLEKIVSFMEKSKADDVKEQDTLDSYNEMNEYMKADNHKEVMDVFREAIKNKKRAMKEMAKEAKKRQAQEKAKEKKPEAPKPEAPKPKAEAPKPEAPKPKAEAPKPEAPKPTAKTVEPTPPAPPTATPAPPVVTPKPPVVKPAITEAAKTAAKIGMGGTKGLVLASLVAAGYSTQAQANIMANVQKESNFIPRSEEVPKPAKIFSMFGGPEVGKTKSGRPLNKSGNIIRFPTLRDAENIVAAGPEAYFNKVYDGRMGNTVPGDGYKYRGRGFIQITGKDMYQRVGKMIGEDLVSNPDLANQPEIAAKIVPAFFKLKAKERKISEEEYNKIDTVNMVVGSADMKSRELRKELSKSYADQLNSLTAENADMKKDMSQGSGATVEIMNQNNITNIQRNITPPNSPKEELNPRMRR